MKIIKSILIFLLISHCSSIQEKDKILLVSDGIIIKGDKISKNLLTTRLSKNEISLQKCYIYNSLYHEPTFMSYYEFGEYIKQKFPQANGIENLKVKETNKMLDGNLFYKIFFVENCFYYSGIPILIHLE